MDLDTWIGRTLEKLSFVEWDRYIEGKYRSGKYTQVFGWIERDKDEYKDFVFLQFNHWNREVLFLGTSSAKYSERIHKILYPNDEQGHNDCQRVEDRFDILNAIEIDQKLSHYKSKS